MSLETGISNLFWQTFREDTHQLLAWGYHDVKNIVLMDDEEESITGNICFAIETRLNSPHTDTRYSRYAILNEVPFSPNGEQGKKRKRLDLVVYSTGSNRRSYVMEAKRLRTNGFAIGKYLGEDGLKCFTTGTYAPTEPEAAMVAYIQNKDMEYWHKELTKKIDVPLQNIQIVPEIDHEWLSKHNRLDDSEIQVYHVFLDFRGN